MDVPTEAAQARPAKPYRRTEARQAYWRRRRTQSTYIAQAGEALKRAQQVNAARSPVYKPSSATRLKILGIRFSSARARYAARRRRDPALLAQSWEALRLAREAKGRRSRRRVTHPELLILPAKPPLLLVRDDPARPNIVKRPPRPAPPRHVTVTVRSFTRGRLDEFGVLVYPEPAEPERRELLDSHYISMPVQQLRAWGVDVPRPVTRQGQPVLTTQLQEHFPRFTMW